MHQVVQRIGCLLNHRVTVTSGRLNGDMTHQLAERFDLFPRMGRVSVPEYMGRHETVETDLDGSGPDGTLDMVSKEMIAHRLA